MSEEINYDSKAPFNMAIATLMRLDKTLSQIRDVEARIDYPPEERQRIKIELVKRFYVDSSVLLKNIETVNKYRFIIKLKPQMIISVNTASQKEKMKIIYSYELNEKLDEALLDIQLALQKKGVFMPPSDDLGSIVGKMS